MHRKKINPFKIITILSIYITCHTWVPDPSYAAYPKLNTPSSMPYTQTFNLPPPPSLHASYNFTFSSPQLFFEPINFLPLKNWLSAGVYAYILQTSDLQNNILHSLKDKKKLPTPHHNTNKSSSFHTQEQPTNITTFIRISTVSVSPGQKSVMVYKEKNVEPASNATNSYNLPYSRKINAQTLSPIFEIETINRDLETSSFQQSSQLADDTLAASLPYIHHMKNFNQAKKNEIEMDDFPKLETYYEAILRLFHNSEDLDLE